MNNLRSRGCVASLRPVINISGRWRFGVLKAALFAWTFSSATGWIGSVVGGGRKRIQAPDSHERINVRFGSRAIVRTIRTAGTGRLQPYCEGPLVRTAPNVAIWRPNRDLQPGRGERLLLGRGKADPNGRHWARSSPTALRLKRGRSGRADCGRRPPRADIRTDAIIVVT
jgi:hypothetical protein